MIDLSYGIKMWAEVFFCFITIHTLGRQTDKQMDGRTYSSWLYRSCIAAAWWAVKKQ